MANIPRGSYFPPGHISFSFTVISTRNHYFIQEHLPCNSFHPSLSFIIPVLINLLELKYIGQGNSPFDTHPITIWAAIACLLAYCLAYGIELGFSSSHLSPTCIHALRRSTVVFGSLSLASLASVLFPDLVRPYLYVLYALLSVGKFLHIIVKIHMFFNNVEIGSSNGNGKNKEDPSIPPLLEMSSILRVFYSNVVSCRSWNYGSWSRSRRDIKLKDFSTHASTQQWLRQKEQKRHLQCLH